MKCQAIISGKSKTGQEYIFCAATDVYSDVMILIWLCINKKDFQPVVGKEKGLLSSLLCCGDHIKAKSIKAHEIFGLSKQTLPLCLTKMKSLMRIYQLNFLKQSNACGRITIFVEEKETTNIYFILQLIV